jgi:hypothetical protein
MELFLLPVIGMLFLSVIVIAVIIRLVAGANDHGRIKRHIEEQGGTFLDATWTPFGPGWIGSEHERIYLVRFLDKQGELHKAHCKTSMLAGVYMTGDSIVPRY